MTKKKPKPEDTSPVRAKVDSGLNRVSARLAAAQQKTVGNHTTSGKSPEETKAHSADVPACTKCLVQDATLQTMEAKYEELYQAQLKLQELFDQQRKEIQELKSKLARFEAVTEDATSKISAQQNDIKHLAQVSNNAWKGLKKISRTNSRTFSEVVAVSNNSEQRRTNRTPIEPKPPMPRSQVMELVSQIKVTEWEKSKNLCRVYIKGFPMRVYWIIKDIMDDMGVKRNWYSCLSFLKDGTLEILCRKKFVADFLSCFPFNEDNTAYKFCPSADPFQNIREETIKYTKERASVIQKQSIYSREYAEWLLEAIGTETRIGVSIPGDSAETFTSVPGPSKVTKSLPGPSNVTNSSINQIVEQLMQTGLKNGTIVIS